MTQKSSDVRGEARLAESLSMAFLMLLENLSPVERAVFLLHEVFDYDYEEISTIVGKSEANCRQILRRARQHLRTSRPRFDPSSEHRDRLVRQFAQVAAEGDMDGLLSLLAEDITLWSDGGGKTVAALKPIYGADKVARFIMGVIRKFVPANQVSFFEEVNSQPGIVNYVGGKTANGTFSGLSGVVLLIAGTLTSAGS